MPLLPLDLMLLATQVPGALVSLPCRPRGDKAGTGEEVTGVLVLMAWANAAAASHLQEASAMEQGTSASPAPSVHGAQTPRAGCGQGEMVTGKASQHHMPQR